MFSSKESFIKHYNRRALSLFGKSLEECTINDKYRALASLVRDSMNAKWAQTNRTYLDEGARQVYYFSLEFLVGKFLESNIMYLGVRDLCEEALEDMGINLSDLIACEPDAGLGNGGLGRLAACFLDSLASMSLPGHGCGIRYKYGLFAQKIVDGYQVELPDNWLREFNMWEIRKADKAVTVRFGGNVRWDLSGPVPKYHHENYIPILAIPYDYPILGYNNNTVNTLRLWSAEAVDTNFDFSSFSRGDYINAISNKYNMEAISEVLYPDDSNYQNRQLRLKQQYFFVSAGLQSIVRHFKKKHSDIRDFAKLIALHINDTHPTLVIPELMRILIDEEHFEWDEAWDITVKTVAYTNHTIMPEALEKWPIELMQELLPRVYMIIEEIHRRFTEELNARYPGDKEKILRMSILSDGNVNMANLAVVGSHSVNGVAAVHTELLKNDVLKDLYEHFPEKFNNKTNGITHRRWILKANPDLSELITSHIGDEWIKTPTKLRDLMRFQQDEGLKAELKRIKRLDKLRLGDYIYRQNDLKVDPDSIFDAQVKRIHAYKRQLLNALHILYLYNRLKDEPNLDMHPRTFIFAGKAAPSYYFAKSVIKFINEVANLVNRDPQTRDVLKVVFLENYNVSIAELIFPATDLSEQISTASKEASGTGNMKFMLNGAVTIGTLDGANIEICEKVGDENFFKFGLTVEEVLRLYRDGGYSAYDLYENDPVIGRLLNQMEAGVTSEVVGGEFKSILRALLEYNDEYFVLKDFHSYREAHERAEAAYRDASRFGAMSIANIAMAGDFASDNTIQNYADDIWHIAPTKIADPF
ncbi:glycogen/starch/alpha-glucan phosphorylase [Oscillospiraceae bacterium OttesenSCG-928-G22]|nr:glycogen/starch/alpha-glucan phosphorylase [Oscillospiraceae bacterium OttesenSCG-928-G22]